MKPAAYEEKSVERTRKVAALRRLLDPEGIAIVGASDTSFYGRMTLANLREHGYTGRIAPINPRATVVQGLPCYPSLESAPPVDLVVSAVGREHLLDLVTSAARVGAAGVVTITTGLAETRDPYWVDVEARAIAIAEAAGMVLIGPNCLGMIGRRQGAMGWGAPLPWRLERGGTALILQSGGMLAGSFAAMSAFGVGVCFGTSIGNGAGVGVSDWLSVCDELPDVTQVGLVLEAVPPWEQLSEAVRPLRERGIALYALKSGRSAAGARAAATHTGALVGSPSVASDLLLQLGIRECASMGGLATALALGDRFGKPKGTNLAVFTASGGAASIVADACADRGIGLEPFTPETQEALVGKVGILDVSNPLDVGGQSLSKPEEFAEAVTRVAADPGVGAVLYVATLGLPDDRLPDHRQLLRHVVSAATSSGTAVVVTQLTYSDAVSGVIDEYRDARSVLLAPSIEHALDGIGPWFREATGGSPVGEREGPTAAAGAGTTEADGRPAGHAVDERAAKEVLARHGVAVPRAIAYRPGETPASMPFGRGVLKGVSPEVMHKSQHGLIALGIEDVEQLRAAERSIVRRADALGASLRTLLLEEMVPAGRDLFLSISDDPIGTLVALGTGGTDVEDRDDVSFLAWPATDDELSAFAARATGLPPGVARERLVALVAALMDVYTGASLTLLECNPVRLNDTTLTVLDALAFTRDPAGLAVPA
jgi:acyl-CoA synthetase (NDP forming)